MEVTISDFTKLDIRIGTVIESSRKKGSDKLIRLIVDFGKEKRTIFTALYPLYQAKYFKGKQFVFLINLKERKMLDEYSMGMLLAANGNPPILLKPAVKSINGARIC